MYWKGSLLPNNQLWKNILRFSCQVVLRLLLEKEDSLHLKVEAEIDSIVHIVLILLGYKILESWSHKAFH